MGSFSTFTIPIVATLIAVALSGCSSDPSQLSPVRGKVTFRGAPLRQGTVVFTPDPARGGNGPMARAEVEADGTFILRTGTQFGAVPGWHRVTVLSVQDQSLGRSLVPPRYNDPSMSNISFQVQPARENRFEVSLVD